MTSAQRRIVVGADGSAAAGAAVLFAAREAARSGLDLRIVAVTPWPHLFHVASAVAPWALLDADAVLREAEDLAASVLPPGRIATVKAQGWPADALVDESARAEYVVVGNRGLGGVAGLLLGSTSVEVTARAHCPVLVVREDMRGRVAPPEAPVVVGVDSGPWSAAALEQGFRYAEAVGAPLLAVHAWHARRPLIPGQIPSEAGRALHRARDEADLAEAIVEPFRAAYPTVRATTSTPEGPAGPTLAEAAGTARVLVVGARGRGELTGLVLGSTTHAVLRHSACPVLVVKVPARVTSEL
jgi:nucleotide-binding universal stress UspA family protein